MNFLWIYLLRSYVVADILYSGITDRATPSVVILGTAKGGTTDIWDLLHVLHRGFATFVPVTYSPLCPCRIRPWKELLFFNENHSYCTTDQNVRKSCNASQMSTLLRCPTSVFLNHSYHHSDLLLACLNDLTAKQASVPLFTATASPMLLQSAKSASFALTELYGETKSPPFFVVLLRDPTRATISLYNHGMQMSSKQSSQKRYTLPLEQVLEIELDILSSLHAKSYLDVIRSTSARMRDWDDIVACAKAYVELQTFVERELLNYKNIASPIFRATSNTTARNNKLHKSHSIGEVPAHFRSLMRSREESSGRAAFQNKSDGLVNKYHSRLQRVPQAVSSHEASRDNTTARLTQSPKIHSRRYGLVLNSLYTPQLCTWLVTEIMNSTNARFIIVKSEHIFQNRLKFFFEDFLPFLHPNQSELDGYVSRNVSGQHSDAMNLPISNTKPIKIKWAELSSVMFARVSDFFGLAPIDPLLKRLSDLNEWKYVVVPKLSDDIVSWWDTSIK